MLTIGHFNFFQMHIKKSAMEDLLKMLGKSSCVEHMSGLYEEYVSNSSREAKFVKSLDMFDMYLQAYEYELMNKIDLSEFFSSVEENMSHQSYFDEQVKEWLRELIDLRSKKINRLPKNSNLNTILKDYLK
jgi:5'-deoxynucleotidase YfbR-like HD superfamily hydrolase